MIVLSLDASTASHLAEAIRMHRVWCRTNHYAVPSGLVELQELAVKQIRTGQDRSELDQVGADKNTDGVDVLLVRYEEAAAALGVSPSTLKRLVASGDLASVRIGGSVRIRVEDLNEYVSNLAA